MIKLPSPATFEEAVKLLRAGGLVAFPTETVYGLGANALSNDAVEKIFKAKGRPSTDPLIVHGDSADSVKQWADLSTEKIRSRFERASKLWPGPLSIIVPVGPEISKKVTAGLNTVALRVPTHPVALELLKAVALPIAAPSANQFAYVSPTSAAHVHDSLGNRVPLIIDGGKSTIGLESTVIDLTSDIPTILRPGAVTREILSSTLGEDVIVKYHNIKTSEQKSGQGMMSPGLLEKHYSPITPLMPIINAKSIAPDSKIGVIRFTSLTPLPEITVEYDVILSATNNLEEIAFKLYDVIRELDNLGLDLILIDSCEEFGLGQAIMDRVRRAVHKTSES